MERNRLVPVALVLAIIALGGNFFVLYTENSTLQSNNSSLSSELSSNNAVNLAQIAGLQHSIASLQSGINEIASDTQGNQSSQQQRIVGLQSTLNTISGEISTLASSVGNDSSSQSQINSQILSISVQLSSLSLQLSKITPTVPISTLVVVNDSYNGAGMFSFMVHNTLNETVYAQLSAILYGTPSNDCTGVAGNFLSQIIQFNPLSTTAAQLDMSGGVYSGCAALFPINQVSVSFIAANSTRVSLGYNFNVTPSYSHS
jgi:hypothetical protein